MNKLPNHASFNVKDKPSTESQDILIQSNEIGLLHGSAEVGAEFDVIIEDVAGNPQLKKTFKSESGRFGERIDLGLPDDQYKVRLENVKGTKKVDLFFE